MGDYTKTMNYKGCYWMEYCINFESDFISDCCVNHKDGKGRPVIFENYHGEPINWDDFFAKKEQRIAAQQEKDIDECECCHHLVNYEFKHEKKLADFQFSHCRICNAGCIYCGEDYCEGSVNYSTLPIIKDLIEKGYYKSGGEAIFQGGEPTLMLDFEELIDIFNQNGTNIRVLTNAIKYSPKVAEALQNNNCHIVISIDSGSKEVYKKVKRIDAFDSVCNSIQKYRQAAVNPNSLVIKYVIIPGYNDTIEEIDNFFKLMKKFDIRSLALDIECRYSRKYDNKNISPHIFLLYDYFKKQADLNKMDVVLYAFMPYLITNRTIKENSLFMRNKWLYNKYVNKNRDTSKNIQYKN